MIVRKKDRVVVLGITGKQGTFWTEKMIAYGTNVVAGINPKRAGESHVGVPIFATTADAANTAGADVAVMFIPPPMAKDAAVAAAEARAQHHVAMQLLAPQIDEALLQTDVLGILLLARHLHRQHLGGGLNHQFSRPQFNLASWQLRIHRACLARHHLTGHRDHTLRPHRVGRRERRGPSRKDTLRDAVMIAQVDEQQPAMVTLGMHPAR